MVARGRAYGAFGLAVALLMYLPRLLSGGATAGAVFGGVAMWLVGTSLCLANDRLLDRLPASGVGRYTWLVLVNLLLVVAGSSLVYRLHLGVMDVDFPALVRRAYRVRVLLIGIMAVLFVYYRHYRRRVYRAELENLRLKERDATARLAALRRKLDPHFLFNTLNTISGAVRRDRREESLAMIEDLSECYRYLLRTADEPLVNVAEELAFVESYARLLEHRFTDRFRLRIRLNGHPRPRRIPPLSVQTLVENAVKHNRMSEGDPLIVTIEDAPDHALRVRNPLRPRQNSAGEGEGLTNLSERYVLLMGEEARPRIERTTDQFIVTIATHAPKSPPDRRRTGGGRKPELPAEPYRARN